MSFPNWSHAYTVGIPRHLRRTRPGLTLDHGAPSSALSSRPLVLAGRIKLQGCVGLSNDDTRLVALFSTRFCAAPKMVVVCIVVAKVARSIAIRFFGPCESLTKVTIIEICYLTKSLIQIAWIESPILAPRALSLVKVLLTSFQPGIIFWLPAGFWQAWAMLTSTVTRQVKLNRFLTSF